jgi:integral membrane sensor domain MASE1
MDKLKLFFKEAATKVTTYVALAIAGLEQVADHAQDLLNALPDLKAFLPAGPIIATALHGVVSFLGLLVIYTRVRRIIHSGPSQ